MSSSDYFTVTRDGSILALHDSKKRPEYDALRQLVVKARAATSKGGRLIFLTEDGRIKIAFANDSDAPQGKDELIQEIESLRDIVAVDSQGNISAFLESDGTVLLWDFESGDKAELTGKSIVKIAVGATFCLGLDRDGKVHTLLSPGAWNTLGSAISPPDDLPKAFAVRANRGLAAAQLEDGSWRSWSQEGLTQGGRTFSYDEMKERIEALGPALDIEFKAVVSGNQLKETLLWIEPAAAELKINLPPALAAMKERGGRLRAWTSDGEPLDLSQTKGANDLQRLFFAPTSWQFKAASASGLIYKAKNTLQLPHPASWSDFFVVSREGTILPFSGTPTPPEFEALRNSVAKARAVNSADGRLIFVTDQGRIKIAFADSTDAPAWRDEMIRKLEALEDIVAVDSKGDFSAFLARDGSVSLWNFATGEFTELNGQSIVEVAVGAMFALALDRDGVPHALLAPGATFDHSGAQIPEDLPKVYAIRAYGRGAAAQLEDGSWRTWGKLEWQGQDGERIAARGILERIESLGPVIDIEFKSNFNGEREQATLLWIEPAAAEPKIVLPPALAAMKKRGGRLRVWVSDGDPVDLALVEGVSDVTRIFRVNTSGNWVGMRADGTTISTNDKSISATRDLVRMSRSYAIDANGKVFLKGDVPPEVESVRATLSHIVDVADSNTQPGSWYAFLTSDGRVRIISGSTESEIPSFSGVQAKVESLTDVIAIKGFRLHGAALRSDGSAFLWSFDDAGNTIDTGPIGLVDLVRSGNRVLGLDRHGKVHSWHLGKFQHSYLEVPENLPKAVAIRASTNVAAAQMEDGTWRAWGGNSTGLIDQIHRAGVAVDLSFELYDTLESAALFWVEPAAAGETTGRNAHSTIELPPALAAMKERGGRLRGWGSNRDGNDVTQSLGMVRDVDDFIQIGSFRNGEWVGLHATGETRSPRGEFDGITNVKSMSIFFTGGAMLRQDGTAKLVQQKYLQSPQPPETAPVRDLAQVVVSNQGFALFRTNEGKVENLHWNDGVPSKLGWPRFQQFLADRRDISHIDGQGSSFVALTESGEVFSGSINKSALAFQKNDDLPSLVAAVAGREFFVGLDAAGEVYVWGSESQQMQPPSDLPSVVALKAAGNVAAAQLHDGSWRAWGDDQSGVVTQINALGPAIDISFNYHERNDSLYWIEPAVAGETTGRNTHPTIELPPALAAMKERGGRLNTWSSSEELRFDLSAAANLDDLVKVTLRDTGKREWGAVRAQGEIIGDGVQIGALIADGGESDARALKILMAELGSESLVSIGRRWKMALTDRGRIVPFGTRGRGDHAEAKWNESVKKSVLEQRDVVAISFSNDAGMALRKDGSLAAWNLARTGPAIVPIPKEARD
ncbi:MAG: hypothetical protein AAF585_12405, partial [Verrucomicrobiota bacterium]